MKQETIQRIKQFTIDRDWDRFHSPCNLAKSISIEANELLECFQWSDADFNIEKVKEELADVIVYCVDMVEKLNLDVDEIINAKMDSGRIIKTNYRKYFSIRGYEKISCKCFGWRS